MPPFHYVHGVAYRLTLVALLALAGQIAPAAADPQPNILVFITDDQSWMHAGAYGIDRSLRTPGFDRVAKEGVLFQHAFCAAPSCAPSRAAFLTGRHIWQLEEGGVLFGRLKPSVFPLFTVTLADAGYELGYTGKVYGPGSIEDDWSKKIAGRGFHRHKLPAEMPGLSPHDYAANFGDFLETRDPGKPFCFWIGPTEPHLPYGPGRWQTEGKTLADAVLPGCLPDNETIRSEMLDYASEIEHADRHLAQVLETLEAKGLLRDTLVVVTSDHGNPLPRSKCNLYDSGSRVPLAICWPARIPGGRVVEDFVVLADVAPTLLQATGVAVPSSMRARSFWNVLESGKSGLVDPSRTFAVTAFEKHTIARRDGLGYPMRGIRTADWAYIRNAEPDRWPAGDPDYNGMPVGIFGDVDASATKEFLLAHATDRKVLPFYLRAFGRRPAEELYDMKADPSQLTNLAEKPELAATKEGLRKQLETFLTEQDDPRQRGESPWDDYMFMEKIRSNPAWRREGMTVPAPPTPPRRK
jgi:N-sulfoglucosamine sulfohydrolase